MSTADVFAEEHLWSELVCDRGYADHACVQLLVLRGHTTLAQRLLTSEREDEAAVVAWAEALIALDDARTLPLLVDLIDEALDVTRSWDAVDIALDGIVRLGHTLAVSTLSRLMAHADAQMRFRAAEKLASLDDAESPLRWLSIGRTEDVRVAAAWGLAKLGFPSPALRYLSTHFALLAPRLVGLGARGVSALCGCAPQLLGDALDDVAALLGKKRQHCALLDALSVSSEVARLALEHMEETTSQRRHHATSGLYGDEPLTHAELRDLGDAGVDPELLALARRGYGANRRDPRDAGPWSPSPSHFQEDPLWRPPTEPSKPKKLVGKEDDTIE